LVVGAISRHKRFLAAIGVALVVGVAVKELRWHFIPKRFFVVESDSLFRGGYQESRPLRSIIDGYGVKTLVSLAKYDPTHPRRRKELSVVEEKGVEYFEFEIGGDGCGPFPVLESAAALLAEPKRRPLFFHCVGGKHRTNAVLGVYRMKHLGWSLDRTLDDLRKYGLKRRHRVFKHLEEYYSERIATGETADRQAFDWPIPAGALVVYQARPSADRRGSALLRNIRLLALAPSEGRIFLDVVASLPAIAKFPHALILNAIEVQEGQREDSFKLKSMELVLLVRTRDDVHEIKSEINAVLKRHTSEQTAKLETRELAGSPIKVLRDRRLPQWGETEFGRFGDTYAIGFGTHSLDRIYGPTKDDPGRISDHEWFSRAGELTHSGDADYDVYVNLDALKTQLSQVVVGRPQQVVDALGLSDVTRLRWTMGYEGRFRRTMLLLGREDEDQNILLSDPENIPDYALEAIHPKAKSASVASLDVKDLASKISAGVLASLRPDKAARLQSRWSELIRENGLDLELELLDHLGPRLIVHDYPPHPSGLPIMKTMLIEHDGSPEVASGIDRLLSLWAKLLEPEDTKDSKHALQWRLIRNPESGVWTINSGPVLAWHALTITDRFVVISWSSDALAQVVSSL
jgi:hypothetical protein